MATQEKETDASMWPVAVEWQELRFGVEIEFVEGEGAGSGLPSSPTMVSGTEVDGGCVDSGPWPSHTERSAER